MEIKQDLTTGGIFGGLIRFMAPVLGALVLQALYGAVDLLVVGWFGSPEGISAVANGSSIMNLLTHVIVGLTMGLTVLTGRYIGEKRDELAGKAIGSGIWFFCLLALLLTAATVIFAGAFSAMLRVPEEAFSLSSQYVRICGGGLIFIVGYNVISGIFRGLGNSRMPLLFVAIACGVNIIGDLLFVAVFKMDVAGAALATVLAQAISVLLSAMIIKKMKLPFRIGLKDIRPGDETKKFLKLGFPIALMDFLSGISFLVLFTIINGFGLDASNGYGIAQKVIAFILLVPSALMQSLSAFVAQNFGAQKPERAKRAALAGILSGAGLGLAISILVFFRGDLVASLFTGDTAAISRAFEYLRGFSPEPVLTSFVFGAMGYFNGRGRTLFTMIQGILQAFLVRIPLSYLFSLLPGCSLTEVGLAVPAASVFGIMLCVVYYIHLSKRDKRELLSQIQ